MGPLRTGSSLLSRCIDDHSQAVCLCESEINRALFPPYALRLHFERMRSHGLEPEEILSLLSGKVQNSVPDWLRWYTELAPLLRARMETTDMRALGDKCPDLFPTAEIIDAISSRAQLIYTVRDPRAILRSIWSQADTNEARKVWLWEFFLRNLRAWRPYWNRANLLVSRYEDLVREPASTMARIYNHLELEPTTRFLDSFERLYPRRFLWDTAVDWHSGIGKEFDPARASICDADLTEAQLERVWADADVRGFMEHFGYER